MANSPESNRLNKKNIRKKKIELIISLSKREILARYKGSILGLAWTFVTPLIMLSVYSFVFGDILKVKWNVGELNEKTGQFALQLFCGLMIFTLFSEVITRSPTIITSNVNYVKKVVFPLEILPIVTILTAVFNFFISFVVWVLAYIVFFGMPHYTIFLVPIVILPMVILLCGLSYLLSALGVFIRDINQVTGLVCTALMFLSPVFYPLSNLPDAYILYTYINPLTLPIESLRNVAFDGNLIDLRMFLIYLPIAIVFYILSYYLFNKTRKAFADVM